MNLLDIFAKDLCISLLRSVLVFSLNLYEPIDVSEQICSASLIHECYLMSISGIRGIRLILLLHVKIWGEKEQK